ncbi:MAG: DUF262 domain-containing protein [Actinomycetota bacterium]|nr:DUF262 domain-containing protein [Actinomycetota bacterium]
MQVGESTLITLIEGQKQFQVPLYQRQYAWVDSQLSQLWDDVLEQYDLLTPDEAGAIEHSAPTHFLGSVVLAPSPMIQAHGVNSFLVIDGQQRLTTLLLALCALRDHMGSKPTVERFNELYLINKYEKGLAYYRLLPTQSDRESFFACIRSDDSKRDGGVGSAYRFFRKRLTQPGPDNLPLNCERLENVIRQRLRFVAITAQASDNVHRIFESLNDRGVRLTQADLLRNYVFMLLPTKAEEVYKQVWQPMQEMLTPAQLETLVFVDLVLRGKTTIKRQDIYRGQQDRLRPFEGDENAVEAEVFELSRRARFFQRMVQPQTEPNLAIRAALERLNRWGASTTYPLLLHLYDLLDRGVTSSEEIVTVLGYVESFLVRRMLAVVPTNNLNRIFSALVPQLPEDMPLAEAVRHALSGERKYWPSDRRLREAIRSQPFYYQGRQDQKMLVFRRLEESYEHKEQIDWEEVALSIEHVMPQSLTDEWRETLAVEGDDPESIHAELLHTLGNLTITAYNSELSNDPIERKSQILGDSHLELNRAVMPVGRWGQREILARADELADRAVKIWPAPLSGVVDAPEGRDWSRVHATLAALPPGRWTTYTDLAELIGHAPGPLGQYITSTPGLLNSHRVLNARGQVAPGFHWTDPTDTRDVLDALKADGVLFDEHLHADSSQRLEANELADLIEDVVLDPISAEKEQEPGWRWRRTLRYLRHFYDAPYGRLHEDQARALAIQEGYDPRGVAGFYQGTASLRRQGSFRILTGAGRAFFEENRFRLD